MIGEATSDADGTFVVDLPGDPVSLLGKSFTVKLDEELPPRGHRARGPDPHRADQPRQRPVGDLPDRRRPVRAAPASAVEALQLTVGGLVFSALLAMAALGLSMIFGTTGLTNFAHGELITFGAIMAFAFDQLPGDDHASAAPTSRSPSAWSFAFVDLGGLRLAQRRRPVATRCAAAAPASSR